jgi:hypothetical protein
MKLISIIFLVSMTGLYFYFQENNLKNQSNEAEKSSETPSISNIQMKKLSAIAKKNNLLLNKKSETTTDVVHHTDENFDFEPHLSRAQKIELYDVTNRRTKGLVVETNEDGFSTVDLKKRFSHAHISVMKDGVKVTGEYSQTTKVE